MYARCTLRMQEEEANPNTKCINEMNKMQSNSSLQIYSKLKYSLFTFKNFIIKGT